MKRKFSLVLVFLLTASLYGCSAPKQTAEKVWQAVEVASTPTPSASAFEAKMNENAEESTVSEEYGVILGAFSDVIPNSSVALVKTGIPAIVCVSTNYSSEEKPEDWADVCERLLGAIKTFKQGSIAVRVVSSDGAILASTYNHRILFDAFADQDTGGFNAPTITLGEYNKIQIGMTLQEVVDIIGGIGEVLSDVDLGIGDEYRTVMYMWEGEGIAGANANITFQGGKVTAKAQFGLE